MEKALIKSAIAVNEETRKLVLERQLIPEVRSIFRQTVQEYVAILTQTGKVPSAADFQEEWTGTFLKHYRRVGKTFLKNQRRSKFYDLLLEAKQDLDEEENQSLIAGFAIWSRQFGQEQVSFVIDTNRDQYDEAFELSSEVNEGESSAVIAVGAGILLRQLLSGREGLIANVQTQAPAEEAKRREAGALRPKPGQQPALPAPEGFPALPAPEPGEKLWLTVGDLNVRIAHVIADNQRRLTNEAFVVGGESLRYPGDRTLGASAGNVINCRCSALYL